MNSKIVSKANPFSNLKTIFNNFMEWGKSLINKLVISEDIPDDKSPNDFHQYTNDDTTIEEIGISYKNIAEFEKELNRETTKTEIKSLGTTLKAEPTISSPKPRGNIQTISTLDDKGRDF